MIAGDLPTDQMFTEEFGGLGGIASLPLDCEHLGPDAVDEVVRLGLDPRIRRANRAHALGRQDLAHRIRQILAFIDVEEPASLVERFEQLEEQRNEILDAYPGAVSAA